MAMFLAFFSMIIDYSVPRSSERFHTLKMPFTGQQWDKRITGRKSRIMSLQKKQDYCNLSLHASFRGYSKS